LLFPQRPKFTAAQALAETSLLAQRQQSESIAGFDESWGSDGEAEEEANGHDSGLGVHVCSLGRR
jgi:hypothetical protein